MRYSVTIPPIRRNKSAVLKYIGRLLGPDNMSKARQLVQNGGIIYDGLNEETAGHVKDQLRDLGVNAEISADRDKLANGGFIVTLLDSGNDKIAVIKEIRKITGRGLKEAKELADNPGEIITLKTREEAQNVKERLTKAGAKVSIENREGSNSTDSVLFAANINGKPAEFIINLDGDVTDPRKVSEVKFGRVSEAETTLNTLFTVSVSDADMSRLEGLTMVVKYKF